MSAVIICGCGAEHEVRTDEFHLLVAGEVFHERQKTMCHACAFWEEKCDWRAAGGIKGADTLCVVVDGCHHTLHPMVDRSTARACGGIGLGNGGCLLRVQMDDGRVVESNNVWNQGEIPMRFRVRLPDNAKWFRVEVAS